jgi:hypothetical protein
MSIVKSVFNVKNGFKGDRTAKMGQIIDEFATSTSVIILTV